MNFLKIKLKKEYETYKADTNILDKVFVWGVRAAMVFGLFYLKDVAERNLLFINFMATFTAEIMHFCFPSKSFISRISYKVNTHTSFFVLMGSFFGHVYSLYQHIPNYDWVLHAMAGAGGVFIGYHLVKPLVEIKSKKDNQLLSLFGFMFSGFGYGFWEITEFFSDFVLGSNNQGYNWHPDENNIFIRIFGYGQVGEAQFPLFDSMIDMTLACVVSVFASYSLFFFLQYKLNHQTKISKELDAKISFESVIEFEEKEYADMIG